MEKQLPPDPAHPGVKETESRRRSDQILKAVWIGFLVGIVIFSIYKKTFGVLLLIPVILAFKAFRSRDRY